MTTLKENKIKKSKISVRPFVYNIPSISAVSIRFLILLSVQILMLALTKSYSALIVIGASILGTLVATGLSQLLDREPLYNITNMIIPGIFIGMLLPDTFPPFIAFIITAITIFVSRSIVFKGINCWINITPLAIVIAWSIGKEFFPDFLLNTGIINLRNPSVYLIESGVFPTYAFDGSVTNYLNKNIFSLFNISIPEGYISMLWDTRSSIPAFRFNLLTLISSIIIFSDNAFSLIIPSVFIFVYSLMVRIFGTFLFGGYLNQGDILLALLTSGILFCTTFIIQWYGTTPVTVVGKIILGIVMGVTAFTIIGAGTSPVGISYTILITNLCNMIIRIFEEKNNELATGNIIAKLSARMEGKIK